MPQEEYEVKWPRSNATMRRSSGPRRRRACEAADMPAPFAPMTTSRCCPTRLTLYARAERQGRVADDAGPVAGRVGAGGVVQQARGEAGVAGPADRAAQREHAAGVAD